MLTTQDLNQVKEAVKEETEPKFNSVDQRFNSVDQRFNSIDERFNSLEKSLKKALNQINRSIKNLTEHIKFFDADHQKTKIRTKRIEDHLKLPQI